jgi:hypothetical protein
MGVEGALLSLTRSWCPQATLGISSYTSVVRQLAFIKNVHHQGGKKRLKGTKLKYRYFVFGWLFLSVLLVCLASQTHSDVNLFLFYVFGSLFNILLLLRLACRGLVYYVSKNPEPVMVHCPNYSP